MLPANATQTVLRGTDVVPIVLSHGNAKDALALLLASPRGAFTIMQQTVVARLRVAEGTHLASLCAALHGWSGAVDDALEKIVSKIEAESRRELFGDECENEELD